MPVSAHVQHFADLQYGGLVQACYFDQAMLLMPMPAFQEYQQESMPHQACAYRSIGQLVALQVKDGSAAFQVWQVDFQHH